MASEVLKLTAQIVISHASMSELTPKELVAEIKDLYTLLSSLEGEIAVEAVAGEVTTQYIIRYIPNSSDERKQFRNIEVKVNLGNVKVRARKGYYPFAP